MATDDGMSTGGLLVAFVAGSAVGAAVALLFAPTTGDEAREYLGQRARESKDRAAEAARQSREALNRQRDALNTAFDRVREQARGGASGPEGEGV